MQVLAGILALLAASAGIARAAEVPNAVGLPALDPNNNASLAANASNHFMGDLYHQLGEKKGNLFFSPYSVSTALALLEHGARGNTATEIATTLHLPKENVGLDADFSNLITLLQAQDAKQGFQLSVANALWTQKGKVAAGGLLPGFINDATAIFHAKVEGLDFARAHEAARITINDWVAQQTNDKIKDLLPKESITPLTALVITNAVYFKGEWANKFEKRATAVGEFHPAGALKPALQTELMQQTHGFRYAADAQCQALELPYKGGELAMLVLLPVATDADCAKLEAGFNANYVRGLIGKLEQKQVKVTLPKWKMTLAYDLIDPLKKLGIKDAFTGAADFSAINGQHDLSVSAVVHKAFIEVNEEYTEAAGATGVVITRSAMLHQPEQIVEFRADRPFVYLIYHRASQTILFAGRLADPTAK